jgi:cyclopropane fatty-acyl-phospholipid synthase-like methyltransferase
MYALDLGCGLGGSSHYLASECSCRVAAIDLTPNIAEAARIVTARCWLAERIEFDKRTHSPWRSKTARSIMSARMPVTMNIADKTGLGREVA